MLVTRSKYKVLQTRLDASDNYAKTLLTEIKELKEQLALLVTSNMKCGHAMADLRAAAGGRFDFDHKDLKAGMKVFHQSKVEARFISKNPAGKFELLYKDTQGAWKTTAMEAVTSLKEVADYMLRSNYFIRGKD